MDDSLICEQIRALCADKNALILAHYYTDYSVLQIADKVGDSLELAKYALASDKDVIVFCGVSFMGESAKLQVREEQLPLLMEKRTEIIAGLTPDYKAVLLDLEVRG